MRSVSGAAAEEVPESGALDGALLLRSQAAPEPGSFRARRRERETLRVVRVGLKLFLERGIDQVTADDIADAAAISRRTFFRYFPTKDDVLVAIHRRSMSLVAAAFRDRPADEAFTEALINANRAVAEAEVDANESELRQLSTRLLSAHPDAWERIVRQVGREVEAELENAIADRLKQLGDDASAAAALAAVAWSVGCSVFREWLRSNGDGTLSDRLQMALTSLRAHL